MHADYRENIDKPLVCWKTWCCFVWIVALFLPGSTTASAPVAQVIYPQPESSSDVRNIHSLKTLELCLSKSGKEFQLVPSKAKMQQGRAMLVLEKGKEIDVMWTMTSKERETSLLPIRIPVDRGLLGWRLFLIRKEEQPKFDAVQTLDDLKKLTAGQGHDWPDTTVLKENGLRVVTGPTYDGLFQMLSLARFDFFPRSVKEIYSEISAHQSDGLEVEKRIVIHYPTALYYFVNRNNAELARYLNAGCETAVRDGSFKKLFDEVYGPIIAESDMKNRKIFHLVNSLLPSQTPVSRKELWYSP